MLVVLASLAAAAGPPTPDPEVATADLVQRTLPSLRARREGARARVQAAEAFFAGRSAMGPAFPDLAGRPLLDPVVLAAERAALVRASRERAAERVLSPPAGLPAAAAARWAAALADALDAEAQADLHRQRLIAALEAGVARAPGLADPAADAILVPLRAARDAARARIDDPATADAARAEALAAAEAAGSAEQRIRALRAACLEAMAVPGSRGCAAQGHEVALALGTARPEVRRALSMALRAALPLLDDEERPSVEARVRAADLQGLTAEAADLERRVAETRASAAAPGRGVPGDLAVLDAAVKAARARADAVGPAPAPVGDPELDAAAARVHALTTALRELELARAEALASAARAVADQTQAARAAQANDEAEAARRDAEEARGRAQDATRDREVAIRDTTARVLEARAARHDEARGRLAELRAELAARLASSEEAAALPPLDPGRQAALDEAYLAVRRLVSSARDEMDRLRADRQALLEDNERVESDPALDDGGIPALAPARAALVAALTARADDADAELRGAVELMQDARAIRRRLWPEASVAARSIARRTFLMELGDEVREIPLMLDMNLVRAGRGVVGLAGQALDVTLWWAFVWWSIELVAVIGAWRWTRARLPALVGEFAERQARDEDAARWLGDPRNLVLPGTRLAHHLLDAVVIALGLWWLGGRAPWIGVVLVGALGYEVARAGSHAVDVLLATPEEPRPALWVVSRDDRERTRASVRLVVIWFFTEWALGRVALGILDADRLAEVVDTLGFVAAIGIGVTLMARWAPTIHHRLATDPDPDAAVRWLVAHPGPPGSLRSVATAGVGVAVLAARAVLESLRQRGGEGRLGWFGAALERRRLAAVAEAEPTGGPDPRIQERLAAVPAPPPRDRELAALRDAFTRWDRERVRGLAAICGEAGSGRTAVLTAFGASVALPVQTLASPARITDPAEARRWLVTGLGCAASDAEEDVVRTLLALPPRVMVIDDLHRLFLRTVGGYDALRAVLSILQQTCGRHFWVVSCQKDAWTVLEGLPQRVPLGAFRTVIRTTPLGPVALRDWLVARASAAGIELRWDRLAGGPAAATELAIERCENAWFRLLADASGGNPRLALEVFSASLRPIDDRRVDVVLPSTADPGLLERTSDAAHFVLAALLQHRSLDVASLSLVLNLSADTVRSASLELAADGVLEARGAEWGVRPRWLPAVQRVLRQRHFVAEE